ncbi:MULTISPECIES: zf-HC2 domain-containing protein [Catenuloplanes]|uniref:Anti-sigma-YlaC factor YlaD n=1 Tax=Catenuloplanes niger TaxID=587534 RepID=A0AAE3ZI00_9ACTN|nr:zf-HC2 domain-containing protein [Catenuloplanes niger]MDR7320314.1 putative anti-sigma-YlaC factor YlaD [Catenuloplanes niger]
MLIDHPVAELLGVYYLDALPDAQDGEIEAHLAVCAACRGTADEIVELVAALALVRDEHRAGLLDAFGVLHRDRDAPPPSAFARFAPMPVATPADDLIEDLAATPDVGPLVRAGRLRRRPRDRGRARALAATGTLFCAALLVAGLAVTSLARAGDTPGAAGPYVTAAATGRAGGVSLSVVVSEPVAGESLVAATVSGLDPDEPYQLHATTADGRTALVSTWVDTGRVRDVTGRLDAVLTDVVAVTVTEPDGGTVVTVELGGTNR